MKKLFNHILVPISLNGHTGLLMEKAVQIANRFDCDIHLLCLQTSGIVLPFVHDGNLKLAAANGAEAANAMKLKTLIDTYRAGLADGLLMTSTTATGNLNTLIKEQVITRQIDLIVLSRHEKKRHGDVFHKVDVNQLAQQTQCPVLTVTDEFDAGHLQNIVVPVDDFLPIRKLTAATYLARRFNAVIHLMGGRSNSTAENRQKDRSLTRAYQLLRDYTNVKVFCSTQEGYTTAEDTLAYAENVKADLIVVNSGKESLLRGWFSKWLGKYLYKKSTIPVLTISPRQ